MSYLREILTLLAAALLAVGCDSKAGVDVSGDSECGTATFSCTMLSSVSEITRSESIYQIPEDLIPTADEMTIKITGTYTDSDTQAQEEFSYGPLLLSEYHKASPMIYAGSDYVAQLYYGSQEQEGATFPYFAGEVTFEVIARGSTTEEVSVELQNSIIAVQSTELFDAYYTDAQFTLKSSAGNNFDFTLPSDEIVFLAAGSTLWLSGSATKVRDGESVSFNSTEIGVSIAKTLSRIIIDANGVGGGGLEITFDDSLTEMEPVEIELNEQ